MRSLGSVALELCALAAGEADLFVAMQSAPWDHNAARIILTEAGGCICRLTGSPCRWGRKAPCWRPIPCSWPRTCQRAASRAEAQEDKTGGVPPIQWDAAGLRFASGCYKASSMPGESRAQDLYIGL